MGFRQFGDEAGRQAVLPDAVDLAARRERHIGPPLRPREADIGEPPLLPQPGDAGLVHRPLVGEEPLLPARQERSEEHTSELQSLMRISYAVFCLKKKKPTD